MKKLFIGCVCALSVAIGGVAAAENTEDYYAASYDGLWVCVVGSSMEVFLPKRWSVSPSPEVPAGLFAQDAETGASMRLSLRLSEEKSVDELSDAYSADAQYVNVQRMDVGGVPYVLFELPSLDAYMGVTDVEFAQVFTFAFAPKDAPGLRALAQEIMASLRKAKGGNG
jgi:hypothetical protein